MQLDSTGEIAVWLIFFWVTFILKWRHSQHSIFTV